MGSELTKAVPRFVHGRVVDFMAEADGWVMVRDRLRPPPFTMLLTEWMRFPDVETGQKYWDDFKRSLAKEGKSDD